MTKKSYRLDVKHLSASSKKGFASLAGVNRSIVPSHVTRMANSVEKMGVLRPVVVSTMSFITGSPNTYIVDGQHLYNALIRIGCDIPYVEIEISSYEELVAVLATLNNSSKSWTMKDYITVWCTLHHDYKKLSNYHNIYDIELSQLAEILMHNTCVSVCGGNNNVSQKIKKGLFEINNEPRGVQLLDFVTDALKIIPRLDRISNKMFISCYVNFVVYLGTSYEHSKFMRLLEHHKDKFKLATQDPEEFRKLFKLLV